MGTYNPKQIKQYKRGDILSATDFNELVKRVKRLENMQAVVPLHIDSNSSGLLLKFAEDIGIMVLARTNERIGASDDGMAYKYDWSTEYNPHQLILTNQLIRVHNFHNWTIQKNKKIITIRYPGNRRYYIVSADC